MAIFTSIAAGISTLLSGTFLSGAIGSFLLKTVVGVGLNLLASAIAGKPDRPTFSVQGNLQAAGDVPRSFIMGRTATAGSLVYANTWGNAGKTPNAYFTQVIALSDMPTQSLNRVWVNGEPVTLLPAQAHPEYGIPVQEYRKGSNDHLWIKFYDGNQTATDTFLNGRVASADRPYGGNRVGFGVSYAICTAKVEEELFTGFPSYRFELNGMRLYDPSRDSSVGGSGTQRLATPSTWGGDGDHLPAVQIYNLMLGMRYGPNWFYGVQNISPMRLPALDWIAQINKCRLQVPAAGGVTEVQYQTGLEIQLNAQLADAIEALSTGCQGRLIETGGSYKIRLGAPDLPVASFTDGEIISTEAQSFSPFFGLADTVNGIAATYPDPDQNWNNFPAPSLFRTDLEPSAGNRRLMADIQIGAVYRPSQIQRLMKSALDEAQRARRHTIVMSPGFWPLEAGDYIEWTSERNGYVAKLFRVDGIVDKANLDVIIDITEVDPADYDWNPATDYRAPVYGPIGVVRPQPHLLTGWQAFPDAIYDDQGVARRPTIRVYYDGDQSDVRSIRVRVLLASDGSTQFDGEALYGAVLADGERKTTLLNGVFLPNTDYLVIGQYLPFSDRPTLPSDGIAVRTDNILLTGEDIYLPGLVEEVEQSVLRGIEFATTGARQAIEQALQLAVDISEQDAGNFNERQSVRKRIVVASNGLSASFDYKLDLAVGPTSAIAQQILTLTASINGKADSSVVNLLSARVDDIEGEVTAVSQSILQTNAQVGRLSASGFFRVYSEATSGGALSRIGLAAEASDGGTASTAAIFLEAIAGGQNQIGLIADRIFMSSSPSGAKSRPFVFQGGALYLDQAFVNWAKITDVQITNAQIANLTVGTSNLDFNAVTQTGSVATINVSSNTVGPHNLGSLTAPSGSGSFVSLSGTFSISVTSSDGRAATLSCEVVVVNQSTGAEVLSGGRLTVTSNSTGQTVPASLSVNIFQIDQSVRNTGDNVYNFFVRTVQSTGVSLINISFSSGSFRNILWKR